MNNKKKIVDIEIYNRYKNNKYFGLKSNKNS